MPWCTILETPGQGKVLLLAMQLSQMIMNFIEVDVLRACLDNDISNYMQAFLPYFMGLQFLTTWME